MLSNVSDDLAKWEVDHLLIYYSCPTKNNAIFGMHALHFFFVETKGVHMSRCGHTRRSGRSTSGLLSFSHFNFEGVCGFHGRRAIFYTLVRGAWIMVLHQASYRGG